MPRKFPGGPRTRRRTQRREQLRAFPHGPRAVCLVLAVGLLTGCEPSGPPSPGPGPAPAAESAAGPVGEAPRAPWFAEEAVERGLAWRHDNGMSGERYFCETVGPGGALFDADGDGDLDLFVVQGTVLGDIPVDRTTFPPAPDAPRGDRLFRNLFVETGTLRFEDVTEAAGIVESEYGMGATVGDFDGDGDTDLFVSNFGPDRLWSNRGDGTFEDATARAGIGDPRWTTSAAFCDPDEDGDLDLFVCAYVDFSLENHKPCYSESSAIDYCGPSSFRALADRYYRNRGDGTFEDASASSRIGTETGAGLGVIATDLDGDGRVDLYVANDGTPNRLWRNAGDGSFEDIALLAGCAYNRDGRAEASMGVEAADFDGDGDEDIFLTHLTDETNTLYRNEGDGVFEDASAGTGVGVPSRAFTGFGAGGLDVDLDGHLDLFIANGAVKTIEALAAAGDPFPLHQPNQLFRNRGDGTFEEVPAALEPALALSEVSRGAIFGDLDDDGGVDIVVLNNCGPLHLLHRRPPPPGTWIGFDVRRAGGDRPALGAVVRLTTREGHVRHRRVRVAASYLSANDARVVFGLGAEGDLPVRVEVTLPSGAVHAFDAVEPGRYHRLELPTAGTDGAGR